jgi:hypothetical protein
MHFNINFTIFMVPNNIQNLIAEFNGSQEITLGRRNQILTLFQAGLNPTGDFQTDQNTNLTPYLATHYAAQVLFNLLGHTSFLTSVFNKNQANNQGEDQSDGQSDGQSEEGHTDYRFYKTCSIINENGNQVRVISCDETEEPEYDNNTGTPRYAEDATLKFSLDANNQIISPMLMTVTVSFLSDENDIDESYTYNVTIHEDHPFFQIFQNKRDMVLGGVDIAMYATPIASPQATEYVEVVNNQENFNGSTDGENQVPQPHSQTPSHSQGTGVQSIANEPLQGLNILDQNIGGGVQIHIVNLPNLPSNEGSINTPSAPNNDSGSSSHRSLSSQGGAELPLRKQFHREGM